jgi:NAD(P)-dependent dehydrogenase (short-subunit alcohol dehydrogenase family)
MDGEAAAIDKVLLITGTSSGIGLASAVASARAGFTTVATVRNLDRADSLHAAGVIVDVQARRD